MSKRYAVVQMHLRPIAPMARGGGVTDGAAPGMVIIPGETMPLPDFTAVAAPFLAGLIFFGEGAGLLNEQTPRAKDDAQRARA